MSLASWLGVLPSFHSPTAHAGSDWIGLDRLGSDWIGSDRIAELQTRPDQTELERRNPSDPGRIGWLSRFVWQGLLAEKQALRSGPAKLARAQAGKPTLPARPRLRALQASGWRPDGEARRLLAGRPVGGSVCWLAS